MLHNMAYALLIIAKHHAKASDDDLKRLRLFCQKLKPKRGGMTEKTRLRQFDDPQALNRLLLLPEVLVFRECAPLFVVECFESVERLKDWRLEFTLG